MGRNAESVSMLWRHHVCSEEDTLLHEFAHGVHDLGAALVLPEFDSRLRALYDQAKVAGRWKYTYAITSYKEYFVSL